MYKIIFSILLYFISITTNSNAIEADVFVQSTVNRASTILSKEISKDQKIQELKVIAEETVDIEGIGLYTLGAYRKEMTENELNKYRELFEQYFLKSFSSRLSEYTNPEITVNSKEVLSENYTIVSSILKGTSERPEVKIDWRIYTKNPKMPLIRDLLIEGLSLARTQKEEFSSIINSNNGDFKTLFIALEEFIKN